MELDGAERLRVATEAAKAGGERALSDFRGEFDVETKSSPTDLVTQIDRAAQERVCAVIEEAFSDDPIVGEEGDQRKAVPESGRAWIVDPIDGTANYVRGQRLWATAVAAVEDGEAVAAVVYAPALGDCYVAGDDDAERDGTAISVSPQGRAAAASVCPTLTWPDEVHHGELQIGERLSDRFGNWRRFGSAQLELAFVADGGLDAAIAGVRGEPWDTVAGTHLVRAAGGTVTDADGEPWRHDADSLVASNGQLHHEARAVLEDADEMQSVDSQ